MKEVKKICADKNCSNEFTPFNTIQKYCSEKCLFKNNKPNLKLKPLYTPPKSKKCLECGEKFVSKNVSTEKVCSKYECRVEYALKIVEKNKVSKEKLEKRKRAEEKKKLRDNITNWKNELQVEINKIVRLIDYQLPCLAKNIYANQIHAGHIFSRGSNPTIRYNLHNIHRQSAQSNHFQNDDGLLREGLVKEYGQDYMNFISELRRTEKLPYKAFEYQEFTLKAKKIVLKLKKENKKYSLNKRIELRNQINLELGIYQEEFCIFNY